jgi:hypothetical protein
MEEYKLIGYLFNGKFYNSLDDLRGRTMTEDNKPKELYVKIKR